jgi:hypothetical protein
MTYLTKTEAWNVLIHLGMDPEPAWDWIEEARTDGVVGPALPGIRVTYYAADAQACYAVIGPAGPLGRDARPAR